ncbi:hypothetical protein DdX_14149 [Ditylenchus destructor]|uniref:F-box domain-containing protein n=1 Tax=Ditylenchus destructor TaxID=166010 RepID=A0AAD4R283_9BILA|nr:hypothetical protein DdX_14149 [Ditylenchus destructor]
MSPATNYLIHNVYRFFTRRQLFLLSLISRRSRRIVADGFPNEPYVVVNVVLHYSDELWKLINSQQIITYVPPSFAEKLSDKKFIRFDQCEFHIPTLSMANQMLPPISHVWKNHSVNLQLMLVEPGINLIRQLSSSRCLAVAFPFNNNVYNVLRELLTCGCSSISVWEEATEYPFNLPISGVLDFLFSSEYQHKLLRLHIGKFPTVQERDQLFTTAEERFMKSTKRVSFKMEWNSVAASGVMIRQVHNENTNETMFLFLCRNNGFFLVTVNSS